jgi:hypothetical protein
MRGEAVVSSIEQEYTYYHADRTSPVYLVSYSKWTTTTPPYYYAFLSRGREVPVDIREFRMRHDLFCCEWRHPKELGV